MLLDAIKREQLQTGGFLGYASTSTTFDAPVKRHTTFHTALITSALCSQSTSQTHSIRKKAVSFLLRNKSAHWTWNYWSREAPEYHAMPYPDDADDTFCALTAIHMHNPNLIGGDAYALITQGLTEIESHEGGPYHTWYTDDPAWHDIDFAVNSNIRNFLSRLDIQLPRLESYIKRRCTAQSFQSPYYPSAWPTIYFVARAQTQLSNRHIDSIVSYCAKHQKRDGSWDGHALATALVISSLVRLGHNGYAQRHLYKMCSDGTKWLHNNPNSSTSSHPFCYDPAQGGIAYYSGSPALTAALCYEAHGLMEQAQASPATHAAEKDQLKNNMAERIIKRVSALIAPTKPPARALLMKTLQKVSSDKNLPSIMLPYTIWRALPKNVLGQDTVEALCEAQLHGWIAYTLYDDVIDGDAPQHAMNAAHVCLRHFTSLYMQHTPKSFRTEFHSIMNGMDSENSREQTHCRIAHANDPESFIQSNTHAKPLFRPVTRISQKSFGHALGALACVHMAGNTMRSKEYQATRTFFTHYITARQLGDDAHDWEEDLARGHITPVVSMLQEDCGSRKAPMLDIYWDATILRVCDLIDRQIKSAERALGQAECFADTQELRRMLDGLLHMTQTTRAEREKALAFLATINEQNKHQSTAKTQKRPSE